MLQKEIPMDLIKGAMVGKRAYNYSHIIDINRDGISYYDEALRKQMIRFDECYKNWSAYVESSDKMEISKLGDPEDRCVGNRFLNKSLSFFEFFGDPVIRFEFPFHKRFLNRFRFRAGSEMVNAFYQIQQQIVKAGFTTYNIG